MRTIGVDVGGTKVAVAALEDTTLGTPVTEPTEVRDAAALLDQLVHMIERLDPAHTAAAVGVGLPSAVDAETGTARASANVPLQDVPVRDELERRLGLPVFVANDAQVAGLSEAHDERLAVSADSLILLTIGTGVGGAIIIGGEIFLGATGAAGHLGHQLIAADLSGGVPTRSEHPPQPGTLESFAAGRSLDALAREHGHADGRALVAATRAGDAAAGRAMTLFGSRLGLGIANAINVFDPDEVVVGGGVSAAGDLLLEPATRTARAFTVAGIGTRTTIRLARDGQNAGVRGAALLAARGLRRAPSAGASA